MSWSTDRTYNYTLDTSFSKRKSKIIYEPYNVLTRNARPFSASITITPNKKQSRQLEAVNWKVASWNLYDWEYKTRPPTATKKLMIGHNKRLLWENP